MPYVIGAQCVDELDGSCVDACPVDCIYEGARKRYINPLECIECGNCLPACPVDAITKGPPPDAPEWAEDNARFFAEPLPGRTEPLDSPGGASLLGPLGVDTELAASTGKDQTG
ncbi:indolepyruvate ferredoxin oxidoreductase subunit alpha [Amycolatopsis thermoflava]|uniref:Ferredoxin n=1 Tax=Amycolatopsis thermoflava TaxID=84480 RepID=A0A3N2H5U3_9PSEU|nr:4Fe-4S binding protein [Amycolatopsis thermoflava]ROS44266.1 4Fe-4S binding protein [Amycolatopsis thermoflava]